MRHSIPHVIDLKVGMALQRQRMFVSHETIAIIYTCPMHPQIEQDHPGNCPICGMTLEAEDESERGTKKSNGKSIRYRANSGSRSCSPSRC